MKQMNLPLLVASFLAGQDSEAGNWRAVPSVGNPL